MNSTDQATSNFGVKAGHFSFGSAPDVRADISQNQINRSNARSMGRRTISIAKRVAVAVIIATLGLTNAQGVINESS